MKANGAPEKLWIDPLNDLPKLSGHIDRDSIEYTRIDAFIEKACEFLKSYRQDTPDGTGYIAGIINDETIDDFKEYMKGEEV